MEVKKYSEFVNEAAKTNKSDKAEKAEKVDKSVILEELLDLFTKKPLVKMDTLPDEKGAYSIAGMKQYLNKYKTIDVDSAFHKIISDKKTNPLKTFRAKVKAWGKTIPYWYKDLTEDQVEKTIAKYEKEEGEKNKATIEKQAKRKISLPEKKVSKGSEKAPAKKTAKKAPARKAARKATIKK